MQAPLEQPLPLLDSLALPARRLCPVKRAVADHHSLCPRCSLAQMMTLKQTGKMQQMLPMVLLGKDYWRRVINWDAFNEAGVINGSDVDELLFTDSVDEAFDHIVQRLGTSGSSP